MGKTPTTTQPRFLPTPWVGFPHRVGERSTVPVVFELADQRVNVDAALWSYRADGSAEERPRILMIHGFRGDHHGMQLIADSLPEFEVLVPDLPGYGRTPPVSASPGGQRVEHTLKLYATMVDALAGELGLGSEDALFGHSFGSIICAAHAAQQRRDWKALLLGAPISDDIFHGMLLPGAGVVELYYQLARALPERAGDALLRSPTVLEVMNLTLGVGWDRTLSAYAKDQHRQFFGDYSDRQTLLESYWASSRHTVLEYAQDIHLPTLLLPGAQDTMSTHRGWRALRDALPEGQLEVIRGAGHLLHYEKPAQLARSIRRFLRVH